MYKKRNSFDGEFCIFNTTNFKRLFNCYKEKTGLTKAELLEQLAENIGNAEETISGWLQGKSPSNDTISKDGKLNENAIIVRLAKFFEIDEKELLVFPKRKGEKKMELTKEKSSNKEKYNTIQIKVLEKLNDVVMEYMILKCHTMDNVADEINFMEFFDYSKLSNDKFHTFQGVNEDAYNGLYVEKSEEEKKKAKEEEIKVLKQTIEKYKNEKSVLSKIAITMAEKHLEDIDNWMKEKEEQEKKDFPYLKKYNVDDADLAHFLDDKCQENSAYGYVMFEIEKASSVLRKEFIDYLKVFVKELYNVYEDCNITNSEVVKTYLTDENGKSLEENIDNINITDLVKDLFAQEFLLYC